jgi:nicotinamide phosphoribosyltransferase
MKATHCVIEGKEANIFKEPITDTDKVKKSLTGRCAVLNISGVLTTAHSLTLEAQAILQEKDMLQVIFEDGQLYNECTLAEVRARIAEQG